MKNQLLTLRQNTKKQLLKKFQTLLLQLRKYDQMLVLK